jgi:hypothetical protein
LAKREGQAKVKASPIQCKGWVFSDVREKWRCAMSNVKDSFKVKDKTTPMKEWSMAQFSIRSHWVLGPRMSCADGQPSLVNEWKMSWG